ncbi:Txe/YoeB family addiction module toxin, partial [Kingella kingae]|uniref:Txe/YoeB family addiction module toxin n=1 Tax=Kingella kingae TaxID=504 RepID=UPI00254AC68F
PFCHSNSVQKYGTRNHKQRNPFEGLGNPEPLKHQFSGFWSRRVDKEHRLVYQVENNMLLIAQCRFHYDD